MTAYHELLAIALGVCSFLFSVSAFMIFIFAHNYKIIVAKNIRFSYTSANRVFGKDLKKGVS